ncbi:MAG: TIGR03790 family protein [Sandaracinaceae bacterium]|nr:TIGR03790 family protein [Sandaracinaceae bacterium]
MRAATTLGLVLSLAASVARATPGPDTTVVVANANVPESVALARRYAGARGVPDAQVCLLDVEDVEDLELEAYEAQVLGPLRACLDRTVGARARMEAAVLIRGMPLRVRVATGASPDVVSLAAALGLWETTAMGRPLLGAPPGMSAMCGATPCYAAAWPNPYRGFPFEPGWSLERSGVTWRPLLVTMLHGRSFEDAARLLESALAAEARPPAGELLFMDGADPARGALDAQYDAVIAALAGLDLTATRAPFDANLTGRTLAGFVTGTASLGETIEGNTFSPGALTDNLTSFGAVPANFRASGEQQVSIARWVAQGVAGAHGTVAEPLNNCFPNRRFFVEYALGATLAEAYLSMMPFVYWQNLVLGDPMAAPYARRPALTVDGVADGAPLAAPVRVEVGATDPSGYGVESVAALLDGVEVAREEGDALTLCLAPGAAGGPERHLLIVARAAADPEERYVWKPKGWVALRVRAELAGCPAPDAGVPGDDGGASALDASVALDAGDGAGGDGCACRAAAPSRGGPGALGALALLALTTRRRPRAN